MSLNDRIKEARIKKGLTQEQLGKIVGVAKTTITGYEKNREPSAAMVGAIADATNVDVNFLLQDEMKTRHDNHATLEEFENIVKRYRNLDDFGKEMVDIVLTRETKRMEEFHDKQDQIDMLKQRIVTEIIRRITLPFYAGFASAGSGEYLFDDIPTDMIEVEDTPIARKADFVIGVNGDSMEPDFYNGEKVFVKKTTDLNVGNIGIFLKGSDCYIKELGADRLISHNKAYKDIAADEEIRTIGKVIGKVEQDIS